MNAILTLSDITTTTGEPRILDVRLAEALGYEQPRDIRKLIERHRDALERFGPICATVAQIKKPNASNPKGAGRPSQESHLNKRQSLYICTKSDTPNATEVTISMVDVFDQVTSGGSPAISHTITPAQQRAIQEAVAAGLTSRANQGILAGKSLETSKIVFSHHGRKYRSGGTTSRKGRESRNIVQSPGAYVQGVSPKAHGALSPAMVSKLWARVRLRNPACVLTLTGEQP